MDIGVLLSNGAFGDQSWAFCQIDDLCKYFNQNSVTVHTFRNFYYCHGENASTKELADNNFAEWIKQKF